MFWSVFVQQRNFNLNYLFICFARYQSLLFPCFIPFRFFVIFMNIFFGENWKESQIFHLHFSSIESCAMFSGPMKQDLNRAFHWSNSFYHTFLWKVQIPTDCSNLNRGELHALLAEWVKVEQLYRFFLLKNRT